MGLDMYAYSANKAGAQTEYWDNGEIDKTSGDFKSTCTKPKELMYWRKHPNLHGWMENLWQRKGRPGLGPDSDYQAFNGIELELTWEDLMELEYDIAHKALPSTQGFFFGDDSDDYYKKQDQEFIKEAKADLLCGLKVFYNSSW
jgi:hypothetical protein